MIDKRLFQLVEKRSLTLLVLFRVISFGFSISLWLVLSHQMARYIDGQSVNVLVLLLTVLVVLSCKYLLTKTSHT